MSTTAPKMPTPAEIKAWPKFKTWALGITPGPTSYPHQAWNGDYLWIYGGCSMTSPVTPSWPSP